MSDPQADLAEARRLLDGGEPERAIHTVDELTRSPDPELAGAAWMITGTGKYRIDDEAGALHGVDGPPPRPRARSAWLGWRSVAEQQVRDGDLHAAIEAYKEADRRAPANERAGHRQPTRVAGQGDGARLHRPTRVQPIARGVRDLHPHRHLGADRRQRRRLRDRLPSSAAWPAPGCCKAVAVRWWTGDSCACPTVAAGDWYRLITQRIPAPGPPPPRPEHVGAVPVRAAHRAAVRPRRVPRHLPAVRSGRHRS